MGASSRSPSPITMVPRIGTLSMVLRMASVATWSALWRSPKPMVWAEAMAASSTTRTNSSASSNSSKSRFFASLVLSVTWVAISDLQILSERADAGDVLAQDQGMNVVRALVGLDCFQVHHVAHDGIVVGNAVAAQDVPSHARALEGHPDVIALGHGDVLMSRLA